MARNLGIAHEALNPPSVPVADRHVLGRARRRPAFRALRCPAGPRLVPYSGGLWCSTDGGPGTHACRHSVSGDEPGVGFIDCDLVAHVKGPGTVDSVGPFAICSGGRI